MTGKRTGLGRAATPVPRGGEPPLAGAGRYGSGPHAPPPGAWGGLLRHATCEQHDFLKVAS